MEAIKASKVSSVVWLLVNAPPVEQQQCYSWGIKAAAWEDEPEPLQLAATYACIEILQLLLLCGRDFGSKEAALAQAAASGSVRSMQLLLEHGTNVNGVAGRYTYRAPLSKAIQQCQLQAMQQLLAAGAEAGSKALADAAQLHPYYDSREHMAFQMLLEHSARDEEGHALYAAAQKGSWQLVHTLLELEMSGDAP
jgi:hypothetical protein